MTDKINRGVTDPTKIINRTEAKELRMEDYAKIEERRQKKLTLRQRKWIKNYIEMGDATKAAMKAYNVKSRRSAQAIGAANLKNLDYSEMMELAGVSDQILARKLSEGLDSYLHDRKGDVVPDFATRHRYVETALKLKKRLNQKLEVTGENGQPIRFNILAGHGFVPSIPRPVSVNAPSKAGTV